MKCHSFVGLRYEILKVVGHENFAMYSFFFMQSMQCLRNKLQETATQVCGGIRLSRQPISESSCTCAGWLVRCCARDSKQEIPSILHLRRVRWPCAAAADTPRDYGSVLGLRQDTGFLHGQCTTVQQPSTACHNCSTTQTRIMPNSGTG